MVWTNDEHMAALKVGKILYRHASSCEHNQRIIPSIDYCFGCQKRLKHGCDTKAERVHMKFEDGRCWVGIYWAIELAECTAWVHTTVLNGTYEKEPTALDQASMQFEVLKMWFRDISFPYALGHMKLIEQVPQSALCNSHTSHLPLEATPMPHRYIMDIPTDSCAHQVYSRIGMKIAGKFKIQKDRNATCHLSIDYVKDKLATSASSSGP